MKEINNDAQLIFQKLRILYSFQKETRLNDEYKCDKYFESQLQKKTNVLEKALSNDANKEKKIKN